MLITNSRLKAFQACRRLHHFKYVQGYRPVQKAAALDFGTVFHAGLEGWWRAWKDGLSAQALELARSCAAHAAMEAALDEIAWTKLDLLLYAYDARWGSTMGEWDILGVELEFRTPVADGVSDAGKLDLLLRKRIDGTVWIGEHKTSGADLSPGSTYWQRLRMDSQVSMYFRAVRAMGYEPAGCLYDVIVKPEHRPLQATPVESRKYRKDGGLYANQRDRDETLEEFRARLTEVIVADPSAYFARAEVVRLASELEAFDEDKAEVTSSIRQAELLGLRARSLDACFKFNRPCEFLSVCDGTADINDPNLFTRSGRIHPELSSDE